MRANVEVLAVVMTLGSVVAVTACGSPTDETVGSPVQTPVELTTAVPIDTSDASTTSTLPAETVVATTTTTAPATTTTAPATTTTAPATTTTVVGPTTTTLPGRPSDHPYISAGSMLGVVGVAFDETLSVYLLPGSGQPVIGAIPPLARDVVATGRLQVIEPGDAYLEVAAGGVMGWVESSHLLYIAGPRDITALAVSDLGGAPSAAPMLALGRLVVDVLGPPPDAPSRVLVVVAAPTDGPIAEVSFDEFFGEEYGDDSIGGTRYRVIARQVTDNGVPATDPAGAVVYELERVEAIGLCWRGASADGLCV